MAEEREIDLMDLFRVVRRHILWVVGIMAAVILLAGVYFFAFVPNEYTGTSSLYILESYSDSLGQTRYDVSASTSFTSDYVQLFESTRVKQAALRELAMSEDELDRAVEVSISASSSTRVLGLSVVGTQPELCRRVADVYANVFVQYIYDLTGIEAISIADDASVERTGPARLRNTLLAGILAAVLVVCVIIVRELMNNTFKKEAEIVDELGIPVLASIEGYRKENELFVSGSRSQYPSLYRTVSDATREGIRTLAMNLRFMGLVEGGKVLVTTSSGANEGKSSVSTMLATCLANENRRVLIVDMDLRNPSVGKLLRKRGRRDLVDLFLKHCTFEDVRQSIPEAGVDFIDVTHKQFSITQIVHHQQFPVFLQNMRKSYDVIIIDTPPVGMFVDAALLASVADGTIMVIANGIADKTKVHECLEQLSKAKANVCGAVFNFVHEGERSYYYHGRYGDYGRYGGSESGKDGRRIRPGQGRKREAASDKTAREQTES